MAEEEAKVQADFEEMKDIRQMFDPNWKESFKICVDDYIKQHLKRAESVSNMTYKNDSIRRLVAGADQEWELAQQPEHATRCAKIDGALIWQGRGYIILTRFQSPS
jgi:hypothetical protein